MNKSQREAIVTVGNAQTAVTDESQFLNKSTMDVSFDHTKRKVTKNNFITEMTPAHNSLTQLSVDRESAHVNF